MSVSSAASKTSASGIVAHPADVVLDGPGKLDVLRQVADELAELARVPVALLGPVEADVPAVG